MKRLVFSLCVVLLGLLLSLPIRKVTARSTFGGYSAVLTDYFDCDPATTVCAARSTNTVRVLPDGEYGWQFDAPGAAARHLNVLVTKTAKYQADLNSYYESSPAPLFAVTNDDPQCAQMTARVIRGSTYIGQETVKGYTTYHYSKVTNSVKGDKEDYWLFPDFGCNKLQAARTFGSNKVYQYITSITAPFDDYSIVVPGIRTRQ